MVSNNKGKHVGVILGVEEWLDGPFSSACGGWTAMHHADAWVFSGKKKEPNVWVGKPKRTETINPEPGI